MMDNRDNLPASPDRLESPQITITSDGKVLDSSIPPGSAFGAYIIIGYLRDSLTASRNEGRPVVAEVRVVNGLTVKDFTIEEFLARLGFGEQGTWGEV